MKRSREKYFHGAKTMYIQLKFFKALQKFGSLDYAIWKLVLTAKISSSENLVAAVVLGIKTR